MGQVQRVATREGVSVPVYAYWQDGAVATVVLFSGGGGGYGRIGDDGWPAGGYVRTADLHAADNLAIFRAIRRKSERPIWVVGTSMGTI